MNEYEIQYERALDTVEQSIEEAYQSLNIAASAKMAEKSDSNLDGWDYCYALFIGIAGVVIATNESFARYLDEIHKAASGASGDYDFFQEAMGNLLHHKGDWIDAMEMPFKNRNDEKAYVLFHRLLWGHDLFSLGPDNPFFLMCKQKGIMGILQAVRHLLADTASKQGLPLPFSSMLDYTTDGGKTSNYLIAVAQKLSQESSGNKAHAQEIYAHLATIRAQDISAGVIVKIFSEVYFKGRKIEDQIRKAEIRLIAYSVNFFGEAAVGCIRQKGVPYINVPLAGMMTVSFSRFCYLNSIEIRNLGVKTEELTHKTDQLLLDQNMVEQWLPSYVSSEDLIGALDQADENMDALFVFLEGDGEQ